MALSKEFLNFKEAQDACRAWIRENREQKLPEFLLERLRKTQHDYENLVGDPPDWNNETCFIDE